MSIANSTTNSDLQPSVTTAATGTAPESVTSARGRLHAAYNKGTGQNEREDSALDPLFEFVPSADLQGDSRKPWRGTFAVPNGVVAASLASVMQTAEEGQLATDFHRELIGRIDPSQSLSRVSRETARASMAYRDPNSEHSSVFSWKDGKAGDSRLIKLRGVEPSLAASMRTSIAGLLPSESGTIDTASTVPNSTFDRSAITECDESVVDGTMYKKQDGSFFFKPDSHIHPSRSAAPSPSSRRPASSHVVSSSPEVWTPRS